MEKIKKLTPKEKRFIEEYVIDFNAARSAIACGYSERTARQIGYEMLQKPHVAEAVELKKRLLAKHSMLSAEWVLNRLREVAERCMVAEPVLVMDDKGRLVESGVYQFNAAGANKSLELIGRHIGIFEDSNKIKGDLVIRWEGQELASDGKQVSVKQIGQGK